MPLSSAASQCVIAVAATQHRDPSAAGERPKRARGRIHAVVEGSADRAADEIEECALGLMHNDLPASSSSFAAAM